MSLSAYAANGTWTGGGNNTNWSNAVNWSDGIAAGGASASATFSGNGSNSILLDTSVTLGSLNFSGTSANTTWTLSPSGSPSPVITLARSGQTPSINVGADVSAEISVALGGNSGLAKTGAGQLTLSGADIYSGTTSLEGGTLKYLGSGNLTINSLWTSGGTHLDLSAATGSIDIAEVRSVSIGSGSVYGNISGVGTSITKTGIYDLYLGGNNSYTGATTINEGELHFATKASLYGGNSTQWNQQNIKVASGATMKITVGGDDGTAFSAADVTTILSQLGSNVTTGGLQAGSNLGLDSLGTFVYSGNISNSSGAGGGSIGLDLNSWGIGNHIVLSGNNTYTGPTDITGTVQFAKRSSLYGGDTSKWNRSNISGSGQLVLNVGGAGEFTAGDVATIVSNVGYQVGNDSGSGYWGGIGGSGFRGGIGIDTSSASTNLGSISTDYTDYNSFYGLSKLGENTLTIQNSNFNWLEVNAGVLRLTGEHSENLYFIEGGTLKFAGAASIPSGSEFENSNSGLVDISELNGSGLTIAYIEDISYGSQWSLGNKTLTVSNNKVSDELYESYRNVSYISGISGEGGSLVKTGSSTLVVYGDNSYTGKTSVNGGILVLHENSVSQLEVNNGGRLLLAGTAGGNAIVNGGRLDVGNEYDSATDKAAGFYGNQTGPQSNYQGNGILSGNATVKAGGTLGGHGTILGLTSVEAGGRIAPGTSIGSLSVASITFANSSTYEYEVNSSVASLLGADLLVVNGDLNMTLTQLAFSDLSQAPQAFGIGTIFSLMNYTGTWNGGLFALGGNVLDEGEEFYAGQNYWRINYDATSGGLNFTSDHLTGNTSRFINLTATAVPEPSVAMLAATAGLFLLRRRRAAGHSHGCS